jgi:hypothetical protein
MRHELRRRALHLWPALAITVAVGLALLANGVLAAARDAHSGSAPGPLARVGGALVGMRDNRELRRALPVVDAAARPGLSPGVAFRRRGRAESALARAAQTGTAAGRARASHLLAVLALNDAAADRTNAQRYTAAAIGGFTAAITLDPGDDASKYDLELLFTLDAKRQRQQKQQGAGAGRGRGQGGATGGHIRGGSGAGSSSNPGSGY